LKVEREVRRPKGWLNKAPGKLDGVVIEEKPLGIQEAEKPEETSQGQYTLGHQGGRKTERSGSIRKHRFHF